MTARYDIAAIPNIIIIDTRSNPGIIPKRSTKNQPTSPNDTIDIAVTILL
jgi:hypothetical protein